MKRTLTFCTAVLLLLSACGGETAEPSSPGPEVPSPAPTEEMVSHRSLPLATCTVELLPCEWTPAQLPDYLTDSRATIDAGDDTVFLLAQLSEEDISLYGLYDGHKNDQILLRKGDILALYDLPWLTPRAILPELYSGDYDGDGVAELLLLTYTGSGTGVSIWSLTIFEFDGNAWNGRTLTSDCWEELSSLLSCEPLEGQRAAVRLDTLSAAFDLPAYADPEIPLDVYIGTIVRFEAADDDISVEMAVGIHQENFIPYTCEYPLQLTARLLYDGEAFFLDSPVLSEYSD